MEMQKSWGSDSVPDITTPGPIMDGGQPDTAPITVSVLDRRRAFAWHAFVERHAMSSNYHRLVWREVMEEAFGHETIYLLAESDHSVVGVLPLVLMRSRLFGTLLTSMPIFSYGGVLASTPQAESLLLDRAIEIARAARVKFLELRHTDSKPRPDLQEQLHKVSMILDLPEGADALWNSFKAKLRSQIRRAGREGVAVRQGGRELVSDFYKAFSVNMRDLGTPVFAPSFFYSIMDRPACNARIFVVYIDGQVAGGALTTSFRDKIDVTHASVIRRYNPQSPNMILYWSMLEYAGQRGFRRFDFGRSPVGSGTYRFKEQWGARPHPLHWHYWLPEGRKLSLINPHNPKYALAIKLWQRSPVWLTRLVGPYVVRAIP